MASINISSSVNNEEMAATTSIKPITTRFTILNYGSDTVRSSKQNPGTDEQGQFLLWLENIFLSKFKSRST